MSPNHCAKSVSFPSAISKRRDGSGRPAFWNFENIRLDKFHITQAGFRHAIACAGNRARVTFDSYDFSGGTDQPRRQQSHISNSRSDIQHALTWTNPSLTKESVGKRSET